MSNRVFHGLSKHPLFKIWTRMRARCKYKSVERYKNYGGRGITVCKEWNNDFIIFYNWAISNGWSNGLSIERKDVNGNYEPNNCTWIPLSEQHDNKCSSVKITAFGETKTLAKWERDERAVVGAWSIRDRLKNGWNPEDAITTPRRGYLEIEAFGETKTCAAWSRDYRSKVSEETLWSRINAGWNSEEAITTELIKRNITISAFGENKTIKEWSKDHRCVVHCTVLKSRLRTGWEPEKAITTNKLK